MHSSGPTSITTEGFFQGLKLSRVNRATIKMFSAKRKDGKSQTVQCLLQLLLLLLLLLLPPRRRDLYGQRYALGPTCDPPEGWPQTSFGSCVTWANSGEELGSVSSVPASGSRCSGPAHVSAFLAKMRSLAKSGGLASGRLRQLCHVGQLWREAGLGEQRPGLWQPLIGPCKRKRFFGENAFAGQRWRAGLRQASAAVPRGPALERSWAR